MKDIGRAGAIPTWVNLMKASLIEKIHLNTAVHWLLTLAVLLYLVSGLGISNYQAVEEITFGVLTKELSFKLHGLPFFPFVALLAFHIYFTITRKKRKK